MSACDPKRTLTILAGVPGIKHPRSVKALDRLVLTALASGLVILAVAAGAVLWAAVDRYLPEKSYEGLLMMGFESREFKPFGTAYKEECWWVEEFATDEALNRFHAALPPNTDERGVVLRFAFLGGRTIERGTYGHLGQFSHGVRVNEVIAIGPWQPGPSEPAWPECRTTG